MKTANMIKVVCIAGLTVACAWSLAGCSGASNSKGSGSVAATVNGTEISEDTITSYIESFRSSSSLTDETEWGQWLADNSLTPEGVREEIIDSFVTRELVKQGADEKGITVDSSEIDSYVAKTKQNYETDEKWQAALTQAGMTEQDYRDELELQIKSKNLQESFASTEDPSNEELIQYAQMYATAYDGAKRSSHILFDAADQQTAQKVLDQINAGTLDFAEAAKQYSKDSGSASNGGDVGWDKLNSFATAYTTALKDLQKDQVSGLVTSDYGIHIIKCTDVFTAPSEVTSLDQIPTAFLDNIKKALASQKKSEAYQAWMEEYKENADIVVNSMPEGLPYAVDMSKFQSSTSTDESTDASSTSSSDGTSSSGTATTDSSASTSSSTSSEGTSSSSSTTTQ